MKQKVTLESRSEASFNYPRLENQSEGGYLEMFEKELDDVYNKLKEKQVSLNPGKADSI